MTQIRIVIDGDGNMSLAVPDGEGTFEAASAALKALEKDLQTAGIPIVGGVPERHSHGPEKQGVKSHA